jgi:hypothetical protein
VLHTRIGCLLSLSLLLPGGIAAAQHEHDPLQSRGAKVMGFDQSHTTHHFKLYNDGGAIEVMVNESTDGTNRDAIRSHLQHIARLFAEGDFDAPMLVHDSQKVPGTAVMTKLKDRIRYTYEELSGGGRINIITSDREAIDAVHRFLRFQIREHRTGDAPAVQSR